MHKLLAYNKSILAGLIAFVGSVATGYSDDVMRIAEWWTAGSAGLVALGAVLGVKNAGFVRRGPVAPVRDAGEPL